MRFSCQARQHIACLTKLFRSRLPSIGLGGQPPGVVESLAYSSTSHIKSNKISTVSCLTGAWMVQRLNKQNSASWIRHQRCLCNDMVMCNGRTVSVTPHKAVSLDLAAECSVLQIAHPKALFIDVISVAGNLPLNAWATRPENIASFSLLGFRRIPVIIQQVPNNLLQTGWPETRGSKKMPNVTY